MEMENENVQIQNEQIEQTEDQNKLIIQQDLDSKTDATYIFTNEDHTLGNSIRFMLTLNPQVDFTGYSIPHPSENKLNLRLQTIKGTNSNDVLKEGFQSLNTLCDIIEQKFDDAVHKFNSQQELPQQQQQQQEQQQKQQTHRKKAKH